MSRVASNPVWLVLLGACSFGLLSTMVKLAQQDGFLTSDITSSQFIIGALISWVVVWGKRTIDKKKGKLLPSVSLSQALSLMAVGTFTGLTGLLCNYSLTYLNASLAIMLLFQFTWIGVVLDAVITKKLPGKVQLVAVMLLFAGTALSTGVLQGGQTAASWPFIGVMLGLASAVTFTLFLFGSGRAAAQADPFVRSAYMMTGAAVVLAFIHPPVFVMNGSLEAGLWKWGLMLAVFGGALPTLLLAIGVPRLSAGFASILSAAQLPAVILVSSLVLKETFHLLQWLGVTIVLLGIAWPEIIRKIRAGKQEKSTSG